MGGFFFCKGEIMSHVMKQLKLKNGAVSIQASEYHYCTPRDNEGPYSEW